MQKLFLEKGIDLDNNLKELISISVDDSINYKMESDGIRAIGHIKVAGDYMSRDGKKSFSETMELDVLAPFEKVLDRRDFSIKIEDFDYSVRKGNLNVVIEASVYGVTNAEDRYISYSMDAFDIEEAETKLEEALLVEPDLVELDLVEEIRGILNSANTSDVEEIDLTKEEENKKSREIDDSKTNEQADIAEERVQPVVTLEEVLSSEEMEVTEEVSTEERVQPVVTLEEVLSSEEMEVTEEVSTEEREHSVDAIEEVLSSEEMEVAEEVSTEEREQSVDVIEEVEDKETLIREDDTNSLEETKASQKTPVNYDTVDSSTDNVPIRVLDSHDDEDEEFDLEMELLDDMDEESSYVTYHIYVIQPNDTYESISLRYNIPVDVLMEYNHHMELQVGRLVVIPYLP